MDFFGVGHRGATLGLNEGAVRLECPPGSVKAYLPEWPWEECVPETEMLEPLPASVVREEKTPSLPAPTLAPETPLVPKPAPPPETELIPSRIPEQTFIPEPEPPPRRPPGKARFLRMDPQTGDILDPDSGELIESASVFAFTPTTTVVTAVVGIGVVALILAALGVFK